MKLMPSSSSGVVLEDLQLKRPAAIPCTLYSQRASTTMQSAACDPLSWRQALHSSNPQCAKHTRRKGKRQHA